MRTHTPIAFFFYPSSHSRWKTMLSLISRNTLIFRMLNKIWTSNCTFWPFFLSCCLSNHSGTSISLFNIDKESNCVWLSECVFAHVCIEIRILSSSLHCFVKCSIFSYGTLWHKSTLKNTRSAKHCSHKVETLKHLVGMPSPSVLFYNIIYI